VNVLEPGAEVYRRYNARMLVAGTAANTTGATVVFVFLSFVMPSPAEVEDDFGLLALNAAVFTVYMLLASYVALRVGPRLSGPLQEWVVAGRPPTARERDLILRTPLRNMLFAAALWATAAVVFTILNAFYSGELAAMIGFGILLGGLTTCALTYLLAERLIRELTGRALATGVPDRPAVPGVATRVLLAWALGTAVPLFGVAMLATATLLGDDAQVDEVARSALFLGAIGIAVGLLVMRFAARSVADPIESVRSAVREVEAGDLDAQVTVDDGSEVGLLQAGFNRMVGGLRERERLQDLFGRHVGEDVARRALERGVELGGEVRDCAALFVDITGSTQLAASRPAPEVVELLNRFFTVVVEVVRARGGLVNKFEGDAALAIFGAPVEQPDAPTRALAAARELSARLRAELPELRAGIGVSSGSAVAGNVGAAERYEYTVIGDPINEAARLTELAKGRPAGVLASEAILASADTAEADRWRRDGEVTLRGRTEPTRLAEPVAIPA
jgi:adenylate cyclase